LGPFFMYAFCAQHKTVSKYINWELHSVLLRCENRINEG
jgi:hypothetical protein